ncbi:MAG: hypothetical protein MR742_09660 [Clostridiales bacterium]|nr:hypothetical protein [Clostridiales bacterium]
MNYAWIEDGVVTNIIYLHPMNAEDFPAAVPAGDIPAAIGDTWDGEHFYRNGERVFTAAELAAAEAQDMKEALSLLGVTEESNAQATASEGREGTLPKTSGTQVNRPQSADASQMRTCEPAESGVEI